MHRSDTLFIALSYIGFKYTLGLMVSLHRKHKAHYTKITLFMCLFYSRFCVVNVACDKWQCISKLFSDLTC